MIDKKQLNDKEYTEAQIKGRDFRIKELETEVKELTAANRRLRRKTKHAQRDAREQVATHLKWEVITLRAQNVKLKEEYEDLKYELANATE